MAKSSPVRLLPGVLAVSAFLVSCGGGGGVPPSTTASSEIGPDGGTVTVTYGPAGNSSVDIPAGALVEATTVTVSPGVAISYDRYVPVGSAVKVEPFDAALALDATITVPYAAASILDGKAPADIVILWRDEGTGDVTVLSPSALDEVLSTVSALTGSFGTFQATVLDDIPPHVDSVSPVDGATFVACDTAVVVVFNEDVDPASLSAASLSIDGGVVANISCSGNTATLTPTSPLAVDTLYTVTLTTGVTDVRGNAMFADLVWSFRTDLWAGGGKIIRVDANSPYSSTGTSWYYACHDLDTALAAAQAGDEIWIADGTYKPGSEVTDSFVLPAGIAVLGGFQGWPTNETRRSLRDPSVNSTVLSGDVNGDDAGFANMTDNINTILTGASDVLLDGLVITGGRASSDGCFHNSGVDNVTITRCVFDRNYASSSGSVLRNDNSTLTVVDSTFTGNFSWYGNLYSVGSIIELAGCSFTGNEAEVRGGAVRNTDGTATIADCTFDSNISGIGAAIYNIGSTVSIAGCTFTSNEVEEGGAVNNQSSSVTIDDSTFEDNLFSREVAPPEFGGAVNSSDLSDLSVTHSSFLRNTVQGYRAWGAAICTSYDAGSSTIEDCTFSQNTGAIKSVGSGIQVRRCDFSDNTSGAISGVVGVHELTDCNFARNVRSDGSGGAIDIGRGSWTISNCTFVDNLSSEGGGAIRSYIDSSGAICTVDVVDCVFRGNSAADGGALWYHLRYGNELTFTLRNCVFYGNEATVSGGAIHSLGKAQTHLEGCLLVGNTAGDSGGAVFSNGGRNSLAHIDVTNSTVASNVAIVRGGAFALGFEDSLSITNCILRGNAATMEPETSAPETSTYAITRSCIEGWPVGPGCFKADPLFANASDADGTDNIFGSADDGLRLLAGSPCIDFADSDLAPATDITGNARVDDAGIADGGVGIVTWADIGAYEFTGTSAASTIQVINPSDGDLLRVSDTSEVVWCSPPDVASVDIEISFDDGASFPEALVSGEPNARTYSWTVSDFGRSLPLRNCRIRVLDALDGTPVGVSDAFSIYDGTLYVDAAMAPGGDGLDWSSAFQHPMDALEAPLADGTEVWVKAGQYVRRDSGDTDVLRLRSNVMLYGGFAGGESVRDARDWHANATVLDGEGLCEHVILCESRSRLDGFAIVGGKADGVYPIDGIYSYGTYGGGILIWRSESVVVANCLFSTNEATASGGGLACLYSPNTVVAGCVFTGNIASSGGAMFASKCNIDGCVFTQNVGTNYSGALFLMDRSDVRNCTFTANTAAAGYGSAVATFIDTLPLPLITNSIVWGDTLGPHLSTMYSCIDGGAFDPSNTGADPLFVDASDADGPDDIFGTADDGLRLSAGSPCIDAGDNSTVAPDAADLDGDGDTTEPTPLDSAGQPRLVDDPASPDTGNGTAPVVDMGAYEHQ